MKNCELQKLLSEMSLDEKIGQMIQITGAMFSVNSLITGPDGAFEMPEEMLKLVGSVLNVEGAEQIKKVQQDFIEHHPHHIPLLFMYDVINGMQTIFPIPLAMGASFSPELIEQASHIAAKEASVSGLHVTFSPMLDLCRDPRWGRVMESTGEDPWLNGELGKAFVRGYQGSSKINGESNTLNREGCISGCIKHFAGYGFPDGGRDYDNVEISERTFKEDYLKAYKAAIDEGCRMVMTSFNTYNRIPSSGNEWLLRKVLREEMNFNGVVISDYNAVEEMINHSIAENGREAAKLAIKAGVDIDMVSSVYAKYLKELVESEEISEELIDEAVFRILTLKNDLGLFENPFKNASKEKEAELFSCSEHRKFARKFANSTFVLLENDGILPLDQSSKEKLAFVGPYCDTKELCGSWSYPTTYDDVVTIKDAISIRKKGCSFDKGAYTLDIGQKAKCGITENYTEQDLEKSIQEAVESAKNADKVIVCIGEHRYQSGECTSKINISLSQNQIKLLRKVYAVNKNIVSIVFSGRPIDLTEIRELSRAVICAWFPGSEGGNAIADTLFGYNNPQGKLTISFPRSLGQIPIYYNHFTTGRPNQKGTALSCTGYMDEDILPLYSFGYGLSYTKFEYANIKLDKTILKRDETIIASVKVKNTGKFNGIETSQLYIQDVKGSVVRPVKMLSGFKKVELAPNEEKTISFEINEEMLRFYDIDMNYVSEKGEFRVFIGTDSSVEEFVSFSLE